MIFLLTVAFRATKIMSTVIRLEISVYQLLPTTLPTTKILTTIRVNIPVRRSIPSYQALSTVKIDVPVSELIKSCQLSQLTSLLTVPFWATKFLYQLLEFTTVAFKAT